MFSPKKMNLAETRTFSASGRHNLVRIDTLQTPGVDVPQQYENENLDILTDKILEARNSGAQITCFIGAHVIKCGLSRYMIWLMENGFITHLSSNGAGSIHDFELAYLGGTSEHVPTAIEDGSFGMWEETGRWMSEAISQGAKKGYGYGESLANYVDANPSRFPNRADCVFYRAYDMGVPMTYHVTIGTDIIHQHPACNFGDVGATSGTDFSYFCQSVSGLEGGVHMNIGSSVTGPEVFLKALSIARNQGFATQKITTANFDIIPLGDYKADVDAGHFHYYYRPRKNVINRPTSMGGIGLYIEGNHMQTIPGLYERLKDHK